MRTNVFDFAAWMMGSSIDSVGRMSGSDLVVMTTKA